MGLSRRAGNQQGVGRRQPPPCVDCNRSMDRPGNQEKRWVCDQITAVARSPLRLAARRTGLSGGDRLCVAEGRARPQSPVAPPSIPAPRSSLAWTLSLCFCSPSSKLGSLRTSPGTLRALLNLRHSRFETVRSRRRKSRTRAFRTLLGRPAGQRRQDALERRGARRIVAVAQNIQKSLDAFPFKRTGWTQVGGRMLAWLPNQRLRLGDPERERFGNRLFVGETAPGPFSLKLPVQIGRQPHGCLDRRTGAHTTPSPNLGMFLQKAIAGRRVNRVLPAGQPRSFRGRFRSSIRTNWNTGFQLFTRRQCQLQGLCSEFRTTDPGSRCSRRARRGRACRPESQAFPPDLRRRRPRPARSCKRRHKYNKIRLHFVNKSRHFGASLLANRLYLLYKV